MISYWITLDYLQYFVPSCLLLYCLIFENALISKSVAILAAGGKRILSDSEMKKKSYFGDLLYSAFSKKGSRKYFVNLTGKLIAIVFIAKYPTPMGFTWKLKAQVFHERSDCHKDRFLLLLNVSSSSELRAAMMIGFHKNYYRWSETVSLRQHKVEKKS